MQFFLYKMFLGNTEKVSFELTVENNKDRLVTGSREISPFPTTGLAVRETTISFRAGDVQKRFYFKNQSSNSLSSFISFSTSFNQLNNTSSEKGFLINLIFNAFARS